MLKSNHQRLNNPENKDQIQDQFKKMSRTKKSIESIQLEINVKQISHELTHTHTHKEPPIDSRRNNVEVQEKQIRIQKNHQSNIFEFLKAKTRVLKYRNK